MKTKKYKRTSYAFIKTILYCTLFVCTMFIFCSLLYTNIKESIEYQNTWQARATYDFEEIIEKDENGEDRLVYGISTPEQLAGMFSHEKVVNAADDYTTKSTLTSKTYRLTNNINLSTSSKVNWTPSNLASGYTFDGNSFVITGMKIDYDGIPQTQYLGFIKENYGTIKNITFKDVFFDDGSTGMRKDVYVGAACCINHNIVQNISVVGSSTIQSSCYDNADREIGGIVGYNYGTIKFCTNYAAVAYGKHIGGICGRNAGTVQNCFNYGSVNSKDDVCVRVGGIVGESNAGSVITLCVNYGTITGNNTTNNDSAAGGIVGYSYIKIDYCINKGSVTAGGSSSAIAYAGGIAGFTKESISYSNNTGSIYASATTVEQNRENEYNNNVDYQFANDVNGGWRLLICHGQYDDEGGGGNYKRSLSEKSSYYEKINKAYVGGIVGYTESSVSNSYNSGSTSSGGSKLTAYWTLYFKWRARQTKWGLFIGYYEDVSQFHLKMTETISYDKDHYCGPIVGYASNKDNITECHYSSTVSSQKYSLSFSQVLTSGSKTKSSSITTWSKNSENDSWYCKDLNGYVFYTYHGINASSIGHIYLTVHYYKDSGDNRSLCNYYDIPTGHTSSYASISNGVITKKECGTKDSNAYPYNSYLYY